VLALPRIVEAHVHLDKTFFGGAVPPHRQAASLAERIAWEEDLLGDPGTEGVGTRGGRLLAALVASGAGAVRSHVDVSARAGLSRLEPLLELRSSSPVPLQLVAFPQAGVLRSPGTARLLAEALAAGCEVLGGLDPAEFDGGRQAQLDQLVTLCVEHGARLDLHLHERGDVGATTASVLARLTDAAGLGGRVAISHGFFLADLWRADRRRFDASAGELAASGVALVTSLPGESLCPPLSALLGRGVEVVVGSDNIRDSWSPFGRADPLERAAQSAVLEGWRNEDDLAGALALVAAAPSRLLGLDPALLRPGDVADLTLVRAASLTAALAELPADRAVVRGGELVAGDAAVVEDASSAEPAAPAPLAPSPGGATPAPPGGPPSTEPSRGAEHER
jgi:cytosine/adenosine deaminase-related metal-dependent hydrolase